MTLSRRIFLSKSMHLATASVAANLLPVSGIAQEIIYGPQTEIAQLHWNENFYGPSPAAIQAMQESALKGAYYPDPIIKKLIAMIAEQHDLGIKNITVSAGSTQALSYLAQVKSRENPIVTTQLGWDTHLSYAQNIGGVIVRVDNGDNLEINLADIESITNKNISSVSIVNPNNPTGLLINANELRTSVIKMSKKALVIVDEAYNEITDEPEVNSMISLVNEGHNVAISRTFSKIYGLAGLRLGWGYSSKKIIKAMYQIKPPFNVNRFALAASIEAIKDDEWTKRAIEHNTLWTKKIFSVLEENKVVSNKPTANFFLMNFDKTKINSDEAFERLAKERLILRNMKQYKIPNSLRLTIGTEEMNQHFIKSIKEICK